MNEKQLDQLVQRQNTLALMMQLEKLRLSLTKETFSDEYVSKQVQQTYIEAGQALKEIIKR